MTSDRPAKAASFSARMRPASARSANGLLILALLSGTVRSLPPVYRSHNRYRHGIERSVPFDLPLQWVQIQVLERIQDPGVTPWVAHRIADGEDRETERDECQSANPAACLAPLHPFGEQQEPERNQPEQPAQSLR